MNILSRYVRRLLTLAVTVVALMASMVPGPALRAAGGAPATWSAWAITIDFPDLPTEQPQVKYITYVGTNNPTPQVLASSEHDIWADCRVHGPLTWQGGYADFNGNAYIKCRLPEWRGSLGPGARPACGEQEGCDV